MNTKYLEFNKFSQTDKFILLISSKIDAMKIKILKRKIYLQLKINTKYFEFIKFSQTNKLILLTSLKFNTMKIKVLKRENYL